MTSTLIARVAAALDPHMQAEAQIHINAGIESRESERARAALTAWYDHVHLSSSTNKSDGSRSSGASTDSAAKGEMPASEHKGTEGRAKQTNWEQKMTDAFVRYKAHEKTDEALDAMDEICDILKKTDLPQSRCAKTHHATCPGHVTDVRDPSRPCPNCHLIGKRIEHADLAAGARAPPPCNPGN